MKKISKIAAGAAFTVLMAVTLTSCGTELRHERGANFTDQKWVDKTIEFVGKTMFETDIVTKIEFIPMSGQGITKNIGQMAVYHYEEGNDSLRVIKFDLRKGKPEWAPSDDKKYKAGYQKNLKENGVHYQDIDFSMIAEYLNDAGAFVVEAGEEMEDPLRFSGISSYSMTFNKDPKNARHEFGIGSKDSEESTSRRDVFYEFKFEVVDGEIKSLTI